MRYQRKYPLKYLVRFAIRRDKQKYNTFKEELISLEFIENLLQKQNNKCFWFNVKMDISPTNKFNIRNPLKITIDRLDVNRGYSKDNVVLSCYAANCGRANASVEDWIKIVEIIKEGLNLLNDKE